ncbi:hypothetical protein [Kineococcus esterisolvens]|uniref:hypothetical protein n=1 Tax=unclassified Kineococcus TaxID=2621656 RepID=UPI003D7EE6E6
MEPRARRHGPPGWPQEVPPAGAGEWRSAAVAWLLDQAPPEYRGHPPLRNHPVLLAWLVGHHVAAGREAVRRATAGARRELSAHLPPEVVPRALEVLEHEELRLRRLARAVDLLQSALRGEGFVPRL